ncbi:cytochrome B5-like protein isoform X1 [Chenopodium quinoa]|uniref:cytochrome B5-like protein isoform X1 n=1 Tax=Chenopodium quinoa TaxID=63459 RepID=UPI000B77DAF9|nr:cytochrome B5-like protein isoform X1 [Chenopodium quinoa]XP_021723540.1 cytochrome B5-like protein isoform X1 [Chenopodium quinoa]XP_021723541.1 cytochrome B5-like protein isoform X1 [Chenopodium quinoa]
MEMIEAVTLILGVILALLFIIPRLNKPSQSKTEALSSNTKKISKEPKKYTKAEVSLHDKRTDCWVIIKDKVYDVTSYVEEHPGGDAILTHAGDDSTEGFYGPQHGTRVFDIIEDFCIGELEQ